jgi:hypothetical protein
MSFPSWIGSRGRGIRLVAILFGRLLRAMGETKGRNLRIVPLGHDLAAHAARGAILVPRWETMDRYVICCPTVGAGVGSPGTALPYLNHVPNMARWPPSANPASSRAVFVTNSN